MEWNQIKLKKLNEPAPISLFLKIDFSQDFTPLCSWLFPSAIMQVLHTILWSLGRFQNGMLESNHNVIRKHGLRVTGVGHSSKTREVYDQHL